MGRRYELTKVIGLLQAFDAVTISAADRQQWRGLDVNQDAEVQQAVQALILPQFLAIPEVSRIGILGTLSSCLIDSREDFAVVFEQVTLVFDSELRDRRAFMLALYRALQKALREAPGGDR
ncbi:MAG: hypothetical protein K0R43_407 [Pseudoduganella sp.]|jgi:hypothetical protein|nr:hypothetical protein [Pseudoduganella sp.]